MSKIFCLNCISLFIFFPFFLYAQGESLSVYQLNDKQAEINLRMQKLDDINTYHGKFVYMRNSYLSSDKGVYKQYVAWNESVNKWISNWSVTLMTIGRISDINDSKVREKLYSEINSRIDEFFILLKDAKGIERRADEAIQEIGKMRSFPPQYFAQHGPAFASYDQLLQAVTESMQNLSLTLVNIETNVRGQMLMLIDRLHTLSQDAIKTKLERAALNFPQLIAAIEEAKGVLRAESVIGPIFATEFAIYSALQSAAFQNRVYAVESGLNELKRRIPHAIDLLKKANLPAVDFRYGEWRLNDIIRQSETVLNDMLNIKDRPGHLCAYYNRTIGRESKPALPIKICQSTNYATRTRYNCSLLRTLVGFSDIQIRNMNPGMQLYLEQSLDKVYEGAVLKGAE